MNVRDQPELDHCCGSVVHPASLPPSEGSDKSLESFTLSLAEVTEDLSHHPYELSPLSLGNHPSLWPARPSLPQPQTQNTLQFLQLVYTDPPKSGLHLSISTAPWSDLHPNNYHLSVNILPPSLRLSSSQKYSTFFIWSC